jgi:hypothetical protein
MRLLSAAGARLARPALAAAMHHWVEDWAAERKQAAGAGLAQLLADKEKQCEALQVGGPNPKPKPNPN